MKKSLLSIILFTLMVAPWLYIFYIPVVTQPKGYIYELRTGLSKNSLIKELTQQGIISHPILFSLYTYTQRDAELKSGEYLFPKGSTLSTIWRQITSGTGLVYHSFTIIPGWSYSQLRHELLQTQNLRHTTEPFDNKRLMQYLGAPQQEPEGQFFPETYLYTKGISDLVILKRAMNLMKIRLSEAWRTRASHLPYKNPYEALIAASLIEKEAYLSSERATISSVLINRLKKGMLLQFDPSVIYGLGDRYDGKIYKKDLLEDTTYNTYLHKGLPPTPIAMPSLASIQAALHPQQTNYYYFVAKGDGSHQFSETLTEHLEAVKNRILHKESNPHDQR